jgi:hypothetical protein
MRKARCFGTTQNGGATNNGTVFKLSPPRTAGGSWHESFLYSFCATTNCVDGAHPVAGVTLGRKGILYGTTQFGGTGAFGPQEGTAFQLTPPATKGGAWTEAVLHSFCDMNDCNDGFEPNEGRLLRTPGATGQPGTRPCSTAFAARPTAPMVKAHASGRSCS